MKIYYFTPYCVLRARTNQIGDMRFCEGFAENGCPIELVCPYAYRKDNIPRSELFDSYGVNYKFKIKILKTPLPDQRLQRISFVLQLFFTSLKMVSIILKNVNRLNEVVLISRDIKMLLPFLAFKKFCKPFLRYYIIPWIHEPPRERYLKALANAQGIISTNSAISHVVKPKLTLPDSKFTVSLNPITTSQIALRFEKADTRKELGLANSKPIVGYTGKVFIGNKEIEYIIQAANSLPEYQFLITGGKPHVVTHYQDHCKNHGIKNIEFIGFLHNYNEVIKYQFACDALVSYYTTDEHQVEFNLPNKICEYMLTNNPIITPDFPATQDILNEKNAIFVEPENTNSLVSGIRRAIEDKSLSKRISEQALKDVQEITFKKRTKLLIEFIKSVQA